MDLRTIMTSVQIKRVSLIRGSTEFNHHSNVANISPTNFEFSSNTQPSKDWTENIFGREVIEANNLSYDFHSVEEEAPR